MGNLKNYLGTFEDTNLKEGLQPLFWVHPSDYHKNALVVYITDVNFKALFTVIAGIVSYAVLISTCGTKNVPAITILVHTSPPFCASALDRLG